MERELTLKDMLVILLKRAKLIVVLTLAFALLLGAFGVYRSYNAQSNGSGEDAYLQYQQNLEKAKQEYEQAERYKAEAEAYLEDSIYYGIDPYNKGVASILFYVDTGYEVNPTLNYQSPDKTEHVVAAYTETYKYDEEIITGLGEMVGEDVDKKYILELINVESEDGNLVRITVVNGDADVASEMAHYIYETSKGKIDSSVVQHTTGILADYSGYEIDSALRTAHEASENNLVKAITTHGEKRKAYEDLEKNPVQVSAGGVSMMTLAKQGIKYGILGAAVGFVMACVLALFMSMMGRRLENTADAMARYKFPVLGVLPQENKGRWFKGWIRVLEGESDCSYDVAARVVAANIDTVAGDKKVMLIGTGAKALSERLASALMEAGEGDKPAEVKVVVGGNVLEDASTVKALNDIDAVILMEQRGKAKIEQVDSEVLRIEALGKEILGIVLG